MCHLVHLSNVYLQLPSTAEISQELSKFVVYSQLLSVSLTETLQCSNINRQLSPRYLQLTFLISACAAALVTDHW